MSCWIFTSEFLFLQKPWVLSQIHRRLVLGVKELTPWKNAGSFQCVLLVSMCINNHATESKVALGALETKQNPTLARKNSYLRKSLRLLNVLGPKTSKGGIWWDVWRVQKSRKDVSPWLPSIPIQYHSPNLSPKASVGSTSWAEEAMFESNDSGAWGLFTPFQKDLPMIGECWITRRGWQAKLKDVQPKKGQPTQKKINIKNKVTTENA